MSREAERLKMIARTRRDRKGRPLCHLCGMRPAVHQHEIINRNQTPKNSIARELTYLATLSSYLCAPCHEIAPTEEVETQLWLRNIEVFGLEQVQNDIQSVADALGHQPRLAFPEVTHD